MEGVHVVGGRASGSGGLPSPSEVQGQSPSRGSGGRTQKLKQNVKLAYNFERFPAQTLGFNEHRSRAWTVYFSNTQFKKNSEDSIGGLNPPNLPLGTPVGGISCTISLQVTFAHVALSDETPQHVGAVVTVYWAVKRLLGKEMAVHCGSVAFDVRARFVAGDRLFAVAASSHFNLQPSRDVRRRLPPN